MKANSMGSGLPPGGGVILVDKPKGPTSHDIVLALRRLLHTGRVGHTGTLDPMATGLLVICVGALTKLASYLSKQEKEYTGTITFGKATDSMDATGEVVVVSPVPLPLDCEKLSRAMGSMVGELEQVPPMTSAVKVGGERLHKLARKGIKVERRSRRVRLMEFELLGCKDEKADFRAVCSSGTYVRCLASDLGVALGWGAHLSALRRTRVGRFAVDNALRMDELSAQNAREEVKRRLLPAAAAVDFMPSVVLEDSGIRILCMGGEAPEDAVVRWDPVKSGDRLRVLDERGVLRAIGVFSSKGSDGRPAHIRPVRVLVDRA